MRSRNTILFFAVGLALMTGFFLFHLLSSASQPAAPTEEHVTVYSAAHDIQARSPIKPDELEAVVRPISAVEPDAFRSLNGLRGKIALTTIPAGATLTKSRVGTLTDEPLTVQMRPGMRAVTIGIDSVAGVAGFIEPGDRVDIVAVQKATPGSSTNLISSAQIIMRGILVLAMGGQTDTVAASATPGEAPTTATLGVTPQQAEDLILADATASLRLLLRPARESIHNSEKTKRYHPVNTAENQMSNPMMYTTYALNNGRTTTNLTTTAAIPAPKIASSASHASSKKHFLAISVIDGDQILKDGESDKP